MKILIIYATIEGQTRKIADHIKRALEAGDHTVFTIDATVDHKVPSAEMFDVAIVTGPVHAATFPLALRRLVKFSATTLMARPGAFVSVSLAAASSEKEEVDEINDIVESFCEDTGWWPIAVCHAAGALKYTEYDFFRRWMLKRIVANEGGPTDTSRNHEFTDWAALDTFVTGFVNQAAVAGKI